MWGNEVYYGKKGENWTVVEKYNERKMARESEAKAKKVMDDRYYGLLRAVYHLGMGAYGEYKEWLEIRLELGFDD